MRHPFGHTLNCFTVTGAETSGTCASRYALSFSTSITALTSPYSPPIFLGGRLRHGGRGVRAKRMPIREVRIPWHQMPFRQPTQNHPIPKLPHSKSESPGDPSHRGGGALMFNVSGTLGSRVASVPAPPKGGIDYSLSKSPSSKLPWLSR
jgi:hypothetical protein